MTVTKTPKVSTLSKQLQDLTNEQVREAIGLGLANYTPKNTNGCCRVYVTVGLSLDDLRGDRKTVNARRKEFQNTVIPKVEAACKWWGKIFQVKAHYGLINAIYVGYSNCSSREYGQAEAIAEQLNNLGLSAYVELCGD